MLIGLTGLGLCLFVLIHMLGNLLIFSGPKAYNLYAHGLHEMALMKVFELGLLAFFLTHIIFSLVLYFKNRLAKGNSHEKSSVGEKATSLPDRLLVFQGLALLIFLITHLLTFKFGPYYETLVEGESMRDIYRLVTEVFQQPLYVGGYSIALFILVFHLAHGLPASLKTLGFYHPSYVVIIDQIGWLFAGLVTLGFLSPVFYIFFFF